MVGDELKAVLRQKRVWFLRLLVLLLVKRWRSSGVVLGGELMFELGMR